ncbi:MAG: penicillin-binding protein, partial [Candidatus Omnitrophota bacterium]
MSRLFYLQAVSHNFYFKIADEQHSYSIELPPTRGTIYDRNMRVLAVNLNSDSVYANARIIKDKPLIADKLSSILNMDKGLILERLSRDKAFIWIKRKVTPEEAAKIKSAKLSGIELVKESKRFYPNRSMACHLLGAVNIDNAGLEGIELLYDKYLKGQSGWLASSRDARSKILESYQDEY